MQGRDLSIVSVRPCRLGILTGMRSARQGAGPRASHGSSHSPSGDQRIHQVSPDTHVDLHMHRSKLPDSCSVITPIQSHSRSLCLPVSSCLSACLSVCLFLFLSDSPRANCKGFSPPSLVSVYIVLLPPFCLRDLQHGVGM